MSLLGHFEGHSEGHFEGHEEITADSKDWTRTGGDIGEL